MPDLTCPECGLTFVLQQNKGCRRFCYECSPPKGEVGNAAASAARKRLIAKHGPMSREALIQQHRDALLPTTRPGRASTVKPVRESCIDCGGEGVGWWRGRMKHPGSAGPRCHACFNLYTLRKPSYRANKRGRSGPTPVCACGVEVVSYHNTAKWCPACAGANALARRDRATARRTLAMRTGDAGIDWRSVGERDGWCCHLCGKSVPKVGGSAYVPRGATVDHLVPIAHGGDHTWSNVALAHRFCNLSRGTGGVVQLLLVG